MVISAKAADQGQGCEGLPREGERLVFSPQDSGCFAESHGGEADLSLLALSEFPADLGSVLKRRDGISIQREPAGDRDFKEKRFPRPS